MRTRMSLRLRMRGILRMLISIRIRVVLLISSSSSFFLLLTTSSNSIIERNTIESELIDRFERIRISNNFVFESLRKTSHSTVNKRTLFGPTQNRVVLSKTGKVLSCRTSHGKTSQSSSSSTLRIGITEASLKLIRKGFYREKLWRITTIELCFQKRVDSSGSKVAEERSHKGNFDIFGRIDSRLKKENLSTSSQKRLESIRITIEWNWMINVWCLFFRRGRSKRSNFSKTSPLFSILSFSSFPLTIPSSILLHENLILLHHPHHHGLHLLGSHLTDSCEIDFGMRGRSRSLRSRSRTGSR